MEEKARIVIADDAISTVKELVRKLKAMEQLELVAHTRSGKELTEILKTQKVDLVIMDMVLQYKDGISILQEMASVGGPHPTVLVTSALGTDEVIQRVVSLGARYFMLKPYDADELCVRVLELLAAPAQELTADEEQEEQMLDEKLTSIFLSIGIPAHFKGFGYVREAIKMVMEKPELLYDITRELYPGVAVRFGATASRVERNIRCAIEEPWKRGQLDKINHILGSIVFKNNEKPTNRAFIAMMADRGIQDRAVSRIREIIG